MPLKFYQCDPSKYQQLKTQLCGGMVTQGKAKCLLAPNDL